MTLKTDQQQNGKGEGKEIVMPLNHFYCSVPASQPEEMVEVKRVKDRDNVKHWQGYNIKNLSIFFFFDNTSQLRKDVS